MVKTSTSILLFENSPMNQNSSYHPTHIRASLTYLNPHRSGTHSDTARRRREAETYPKDKEMVSTQDRATVKSETGSYSNDQEILSPQNRVAVNSEAGLCRKDQEMMSTQDQLAWKAEPRPYSKFEKIMALPLWDVTTTVEPGSGNKEQEDISKTSDGAITESEADLFFKDQELIAAHDAVILETRAEADARTLLLTALEQEVIDLDAVMNGYTGIRLLTADGSQVDITEDFARRATYLRGRLDANSDDRVMSISTSELVVKKLIHWYQYHRYWSFNTYYEGRQAYVRDPKITKEWMESFFNVKGDVLRQIALASCIFQLGDLSDATMKQINIRDSLSQGDMQQQQLRY